MCQSHLKPKAQTQRPKVSTCVGLPSCPGCVVWHACICPVSCAADRWGFLHGLPCEGSNVHKLYVFVNTCIAILMDASINMQLKSMIIMSEFTSSILIHGSRLPAGHAISALCTTGHQVQRLQRQLNLKTATICKFVKCRSCEADLFVKQRPRKGTQHLLLRSGSSTPSA